jgi:hypothetical protein
MSDLKKSPYAEVYLKLRARIEKGRVYEDVIEKALFAAELLPPDYYETNIPEEWAKAVAYYRRGMFDQEFRAWRRFIRVYGVECTGERESGYKTRKAYGFIRYIRGEYRRVHDRPKNFSNANNRSIRNISSTPDYNEEIDKPELDELKRMSDDVRNWGEKQILKYEKKHLQ